MLLHKSGNKLFLSYTIQTEIHLKINIFYTKNSKEFPFEIEIANIIPQHGFRQNLEHLYSIPREIHSKTNVFYTQIRKKLI